MNEENNENSDDNKMNMDENRESKEKAKHKTKSILDALNADKDLIDLSDDPSDYEDELKLERQKRCEFSSSEDELENKEIQPATR